MLEEPAYEFSTGYGDVFGFTGSVVSGGICDRTVSDRLYPGVCNCNLVGISAKIVMALPKPLKVSLIYGHHSISYSLLMKEPQASGGAIS